MSGRPILGVSTWQDYQDRKWQYVHQKFGVFDPRQGRVIPVATRECAHELANHPIWGFGPAMTHHVSDWVPDE